MSGNDEKTPSGEAPPSGYRDEELRRHADQVAGAGYKPPECYRVQFFDVTEPAKRSPFELETSDLTIARAVLDAVSKYDLYLRPEPSNHATAGFVERWSEEDQDWEAVDDDWDPA